MAKDKTASPVAFKRKKSVSKAVLIADKIADKVITVGGISVIVAVLGILVFLVAETLPLFQGGKTTATHEYTLDVPSEPVLTMTMDEYKTLTFTLFEDGTSILTHAKTGDVLDRRQLDLAGKDVTAVAASVDRLHVALGFADGSIKLAETQFLAEILPADQLPQGLTTLDDRDSTDGSAIYSKIPGNQYRKLTFEFALEDAPRAEAATTAETDETAALTPPAAPAIIALDYRVSGEPERRQKSFATVDADGHVILTQAEYRLNMMTGKFTVKVNETVLPDLPTADPAATVVKALLTSNGDGVMVIEKTGTVHRYNTRDAKNPILAETTSVLPEGITLTSFDFLIGEQSIVVAGSDGSLDIFFLLRPEHPTTPDGVTLAKGRTFRDRQAPIALFAPSARGKSFAVALQDGSLEVLHGTSQKVLARYPKTGSTAYSHIAMAPRFDGVLALADDGAVNFWEFSVPHPETTFKTLFQKVWYEGYPEPTYTWQSTGATEDFESKFSLTPLIFGTIKAAFYSLLFAIPIAILGAIYTSEFLHYQVRNVVKPVMEMMASLPSVVLGFVVALVLAPIVETWIAAVILAFVAVPTALMFSAFLWQLIPLHLANRWSGMPKFALMMLTALFSFWITYQLGLLFEQVFFSGDFKAWVNGDVGTATPFLFLLLLPITFFAIGFLLSKFFGHRIAGVMGRITPFQAALFDMGKWVGTVAVSVLCSYAIANVLTTMGIDARGSFIGTYVQRNTLIVGFAMGFAVIPIIYTIAEDALNAVPSHLRAASLGCGATTWQTAIYVVLPTAVSGVFSAIMIGMGRAVGETMIVVMAAGNTPLMDWNIFNGLRALSATIAVELPEAVKGGTLYRILFLSGLVLFAMTFVINTIAEMVRIRFRKRTSQL